MNLQDIEEDLVGCSLVMELIINQFEDQEYIQQHRGTLCLVERTHGFLVAGSVEEALQYTSKLPCFFPPQDSGVKQSRDYDLPD